MRRIPNVLQIISSDPTTNTVEPNEKLMATTLVGTLTNESGHPSRVLVVYIESTHPAGWKSEATACPQGPTQKSAHIVLAEDEICI